MNETLDQRWLRRLLSAIVVLLAVIAVQLGTITGAWTPRAAAQIPDSGRQRQDLIDMQARTNAALDSILEHLRTQTLKVKMVGTDKETRTEGAPSQGPSAAPAPRVIRR